MYEKEDYWFYALSLTARRKLIRGYRKLFKNNFNDQDYADCDLLKWKVLETHEGFQTITLSRLISAENLSENLPVPQKTVLEIYESFFQTCKFPGVIRVEFTDNGINILNGHELVTALGILVVLYHQNCDENDLLFWRNDIVNQPIPVLVYKQVID